MEQLNDTMTYYETLKKVVDYLNDTSGQVSSITDTVTYIQNEGLESVNSELNSLSSQLTDIEDYLINIDSGLFTDSPSTLTDLDGGVF